jgi:hypothetical protein
VEVQPPFDTADDLSASDKVYVLPLESDDPALETMKQSGWVRVSGSAGNSTVLTLTLGLTAADLEPARRPRPPDGRLHSRSVTVTFKAI